MNLRPLLLGLVAIICWGTLAAAAGGALRQLSTPQLLFYSFATSTLVLTAARRLRRGTLRPPRVGFASALLGLWGVFGFHLLYYSALERAPLVEATLVNYLWPLLVVVFAWVILREPFRWSLLAGVALGAVGAALIVTGGRAIRPEGRHALGYLLAFGSALAWSSFTVLLRKVDPGGEDRMLAYCGLSTLASGALLLFSGGLAPPGSAPLLAAIYAGLFPLALAFLAWERAVREGEVSRLGVLAYLTPFLSAAFLWLFLGAPVRAASLAGMALVVAGAALSAWGRPSEGSPRREGPAN